VNGGRHARIKALFLEALELEAAARASFLDKLGAAAAEDREEVEALLAHAGDDDMATDARRLSLAAAPRLRPGEIVAARYRIEAVLGAGGSGEVYRAHDLVIDAPVALKLLRAGATGRAEAILDEVRLARQITHPAVCRVHDIGPLDGEYFITMEWVDGEDLAARVRRTGGLPPDAVASIAHQLCAGLAAAHARGILHHDLKPANVLIDRHDRAKIADFGLAASRAERGGGLGGTPSYMAPEQFLPGGHVTEQTDLYALGLLLHELLTGRRVFDGGDFGRTDRARGRPPAPGSLVAGVDPALDRAIRAATHPDPLRRPASALALEALLPGGDPLALALATGSLASPAVVATAAGDHERLSRRAAAGWLALLFLALAAALLLGSPAWQRAAPHLRESPRQLAAQLTATLEALGYDLDGGRIDRGFADDPTAEGLPRAILFWQRITLPARGPGFWERIAGAARDNLDVPASPTTDLVAASDLAGRLVYLRAERPPAAASATPGNRPLAADAPFDWTFALRAAGLNPSTLRPVDRPPPEVFAASHRSWTAPDPDRADGALLVRAAAVEGLPLLFQVEREPGPDAPGGGAFARIQSMIALGFLLGLPLLALPSSIINLRAGRADHRGARRVAWLVCVPALLVFWLTLGHADGPHSLWSGSLAVLAVLIAPLPVWLCYVGLEPWARRAQPRLLIAWTHLLAGRIRDPLVGQSLLIGAVAGALIIVVDQLDRRVGEALGLAMQYPPVLAEHLVAALGPAALLARLISRLPQTLSLVLPFAFLLVIVRRWLPAKGSWLVAFALFTGVFWALMANAPQVSLFVGAPLTALLALVALERSGLLAVVTAGTVAYTLAGFPLSLSVGAWYATGTLAALTFTVVLGAAGAWLARGAAR
jgi:serine/threonine-protein kinase